MFFIIQSLIRQMCFHTEASDGHLSNCRFWHLDTGFISPSPKVSSKQ